MTLGPGCLKMGGWFISSSCKKNPKMTGFFKLKVLRGGIMMIINSSLKMIIVCGCFCDVVLLSSE